MPLTLPLYEEIFSKAPETEAKRVTKSFSKRKPEFISVLREHIEDELATPKQSLLDIHDFICQDEQRLRKFLRRLSRELSQPLSTC